jgi:ABC-type Fe3+ transport system substrate-binding protein
MERTMRHRLVGLAVGLALLLSCSPAARPEAGGGAAPAAGAPGGGPAGGAPAAQSYRQQVIEGARREGEVNALIQSTWTPDGIRQIEDAVEREYGVRLKINFTPVGNYPQRIATLASELAANTTPSFDVYQSSNANSGNMIEQDLLQAADWAALLPQGTPPGIVQGDNRLLVVYTDHSGLMYDPNVVSEAEAPRSLRGLGNPKWRGKFMSWQYTNGYIPYVLMLGKDETLAALRAMVRNGAVTDTYANEFTRYAAKEYPLVVISASFYHTAQVRGVPAAFMHLDFANQAEHHLSVARNVAHPNAAKLLAAVLVGPEGQRLSQALLGLGSLYYPESVEFRLAEQARAANLPVFNWSNNPAAVEFSIGPEGQAIQREIDQILKGG